MPVYLYNLIVGHLDLFPSFAQIGPITLSHLLRVTSDLFCFLHKGDTSCMP